MSEPTDPIATAAAASSNAKNTADATPSPWPRRLKGWARDGLVAIVLFVVVSKGMSILQAPGVPMDAPAPPVTGATLDGVTFNLEDLRGKPVFVNLWATWCGPCRGELPDLMAAADAHRDDVHFVGLMVPSSKRAEARPILDDAAKRAGVAGDAFTVVPLKSSEAGAWDVSVVPSSVILNKDGVVVWRRAGVVSQGDIDSALEDVLKDTADR